MKALRFLRMPFVMAIVLGLVISWSVATPQTFSGKKILGGVACDWCGIRNDCPYSVQVGEETRYCDNGIYIRCRQLGDGTTCTNNENTPCGNSGGSGGCGKYAGGDYNECPTS
ncbi:MAG: hypothetical protein ACYS1A_16940 [Planctomycetota bacterium]|jgi:hypothetical protein